MKHSDTISDDIILDLVALLDGGIFESDFQKNGFQYFKADPLMLHGFCYRLVWLLEAGKLYIGVINAFRR